VHINAPFREPLYPERNEATTYSSDVRVMREHRNAYMLTEEQKQKIRQEWSSYHNILIVAGQQHPDEEFATTLGNFFAKHDVPLVSDIISNLHEGGKGIRHADLFLGQASEDLKKTLRPDLLITFGQSLISKNVKLFLRKYTPQAHWHIQPEGTAADTFKHITDIFQTSPASFFGFISSVQQDETFERQKQHNYTKLWEVEERRAQRTLADFFGSGDLAEMELVKELIDQLPEQSNLHLANSMSVRYANFIGLEPRHQWHRRMYQHQRGASPRFGQAYLPDHGRRGLLL
jgi:2-succinyl-5-enolpyruvyl-6-hydroxy-3-cyclohexene-1-carboxylate synthase